MSLPTDQDKFLAEFKQQTKDAYSRLNALNAGQSKDVLQEEIDACLARHASLTKYLTDSTHFLPAYDIRSSQQALTKLSSDIAARKAQLIPRKKFAFKAKRKQKAAQESASTPDEQPSNSNSANATEENGARSTPNDADALSRGAEGSTQNNDDQSSSNTRAQTASTILLDDSVGFKDMSNATLVMERSAINGADLSLSNLDNCLVWLKGTPGVLHVSNLKNTTVCIGPVFRSLILHHCEGCRFVLACQQLRIHNTINTDFYVHVTSRAIIEDCEKVRFAPYAWDYEHLEEDFKAAGLSLETNNWDKVNDFNWLKPHEPSPHWSTIPESERQQWGNELPATTTTANSPVSTTPACEQAMTPERISSTPS